jgi:TPR repeat protein
MEEDDAAEPAALEMTARPAWRVVKEAERLLAAGQYAAAAAQLQQAIDLGHLPSCAHLAALFLWDREGFAKDWIRAFTLAEEGALFGCHHCQGVLACCYNVGAGCSYDAQRSLPLARQSAGKGSKYGQFMLGCLYYWGEGGVAQDHAAAVAQFRLAAAQNFDAAQHWLGLLYRLGWGVAHDDAEALRWFKLAAAQGLSEALYCVGHFYEMGWSVAADRAEAICWYKRAQAAGDSIGAGALKRLGA